MNLATPFLFAFSLFLSACGSASSSTAEPAEPSGTTGDEPTAIEPTNEPSDEGAACAGPYLRGARTGVLACQNQSGGYSQLICEQGCAADSAGACVHPPIPEGRVEGCHAGDPCPSARGPEPAGPCAPACCDPSLDTLPSDVEEGMISMP